MKRSATINNTTNTYIIEKNNIGNKSDIEVINIGKTPIGKYLSEKFNLSIYPVSNKKATTADIALVRGSILPNGKIKYSGKAIRKYYKVYKAAEQN